jgi:Mce-associated membrane protein
MRLHGRATGVTTDIADTDAGDAEDDGDVQSVETNADFAAGLDPPESPEGHTGSRTAERDTSAVHAGMSRTRAAAPLGLVVLALAGLVGLLGLRTYQSHQADDQRTLFMHVGRQAAINLTTIDWHDADTDTARILGSATGTFYDDFSKRSQAFVDVVKQAQSKSVGTVTEAGMESETDQDAQILVAVTVTTSNAGAPEQDPRSWRMRVTVQKQGRDVKVANVEFVP